MSINIIKGDLIQMALNKEFEVIAHGCNCFCAMGAGIAPKMAKFFNADKFKLEQDIYRGDIKKLGCIDYQKIDKEKLIVINAYTQYQPGIPGRDKIPLDYAALSLCLLKIGTIFQNKKIGLPFIGAGLAGGDPIRIYDMMCENLPKTATLVIFEDYLYNIIKDYRV